MAAPGDGQGAPVVVGLGHMMSSVLDHHPLQSNQWHRVASLRPRLDSQVRVSRLWTRGQRWYVLQDSEGRQTCRLNQQAYEIAARLDGRQSVDDIWLHLDRQDTNTTGHEPPTQEDVIELLVRLQSHGLVAHDTCPDFGTLQGLGASAVTDSVDPVGLRATAPPSHRQSIWAWRLPLLNPSRWLQARTSWSSRLFSGVGLTVWAILMTWLVVLWTLHASSLQDHAQRWLLTPRYLWLSLLIYPIIKVVHEAAHALAVHRFGGKVTSCGVSLMMLIPVPYVDASAAHAFPHARQRALVSAAGIMAELSLASLGLTLWTWLEPGLWRDVGFMLWFIGCASTLLFNGNPLQRMDGYHLLTDAMQLPGLATRSSRWWQSHLSRALLGPSVPAPSPSMDASDPAAGERPWLMGYAPLAWAYQWALWTGICLWLGAWSAPVGWAVAVCVVMRLAAWPWIRLWQRVWQHHLHNQTHSDRHRTAGLPWRAMSLMLCPWLLLAMPMPDNTLVQGVVWAPEQALIRPEIDGQVEEVLMEDGALVQAGDPLLRLSNAKLMAQRERVASQLDRAEQQAYMHLGVHGSQSGQASAEADQLQAQLNQLDHQIDSLTVKAHLAGRLRWPQAKDMPSSHVRRGELVGHIVDDRPVVVRLALPQDKGQATANRTERASVHLTGRSETGRPARLRRDNLGATLELPSAALSDVMGGDIVTDPKDEHHLRTQRPIVLMDVEVPSLSLDGAPHAAQSAAWARLGQRAWVRLEHGMSPLAWQWLHLARGRADAVFSPR
jgi:putative peptide zinc metalloprotease protein